MANAKSWSAVWKPDAAPETSRKLAGPCEVSALALKASGAAAVVSFYDGVSLTDAIPANLKWVLDASTTSDDDMTFVGALIFQKGVFAVLEQGANFNAIVMIATNAYTTNPSNN